VADATRTAQHGAFQGERWGIVDLLFRYPGSHAVCRAVAAAGEEAIVRLYTRFLDESNWSGFRRAVQRRAGMQHPTLLPVIGAEWTQQRPSVIFEPLAADLLTELIEADALEPVEILRVLIDVADATKAIESRSLPAVEVTPADIFVTRTGRGILMGDLGVAAELHTHRGPYDELYLAPERFGWQLHPEQRTRRGRFARFSRRIPFHEEHHHSSPTPASTVFSFGCVLFEALTGSPPFYAEQRRPLLGAHTFLDPPSASARRGELPDEIDYVIARALANEPAERYRNPAELLWAAAEALGVDPADLDTGADIGWPAAAAFAPKAEAPVIEAPPPVEPEPELAEPKVDERHAAPEPEVDAAEAEIVAYERAEPQAVEPVSPVVPEPVEDAAAEPEPEATEPPPPLVPEPVEEAAVEPEPEPPPPVLPEPVEEAAVEPEPEATEPEVLPDEASPEPEAIEPERPALPEPTPPVIPEPVPEAAIEPEPEPAEASPEPEPVEPEAAEPDTVEPEPPAPVPADNGRSSRASDEIDLFSTKRDPIDFGFEPASLEDDFAKPHTNGHGTTHEQPEPELPDAPAEPDGPTVAELELAQAAETRRRERRAARRKRTARKGRAPALLAIAAIGASVAGGGALGQAGGDPEPQGPDRLALGATTLPLPTGWERGRVAALPFKATASALVARPEDTPGAGLVVTRATTGLASTAAASERSAVRLGRLAAWRYAGIEAGRGTVADLYVAPTNAGMYEIACFARAADAASFLPTCGRVATGLRIRGAESLPLTGDDATRQQLSGTLKTLGEQRVAQRARLADARRPAGQAVAAGALSRAFSRAADSVAALPAVGAPGDQEQIVAALQAVADQYASLSQAAESRNRTAFAAERRAVVAREQELRKAIDLLARAD
jgi:serine/threonine protein kinase